MLSAVRGQAELRLESVLVVDVCRDEETFMVATDVEKDGRPLPDLRSVDTESLYRENSVYAGGDRRNENGRQGGA